MSILKDFMDRDQYRRDINGNLMLIDLVKYLLSLDKENYNKAVNEIEGWLKSNDEKEYADAIYLIGELKLIQFKNILIEHRKQVGENKRKGIPAYYTQFIDVALNSLSS